MAESSMLAGCRHLGVRLWATALLGGLACLSLLPGLAGAVGIDRIIAPAAAILVCAYFLIGGLMNRMGRRRIERLQKEAATWERAGMAKEAQEAYQAAAAALDGFLLSVRLRRRLSDRLLSSIARFHLSQPRLDEQAESAVAAYLSAHPQDSEAALGWLQWVVGEDDEPARQRPDLAQRLADAQPGHQPLQLLVARYFLSAARTDYAALEVYRRVLDTPGPDADALAVALGELLLGQERSDEWSLSVYLTAGRLEPENEKWRQGLAACLAVVRETEQNRSLVQRARQVIVALEPSQWERPRRDFLRPVQTLEDEHLLQTSSPMARPSRVQRAAAAGRAAVASVAGRSAAAVGRGVPILFRRLRQPVVLKGLGLAAVAIGVVFFSAKMLPQGEDTPPAPGAAPQQPAAPPVVSDPFTIQVAAYFKREDAQNFASRLKANGLDAYWTEALGGQKKWYQVRISHFADQQTARRYGESLKAKRIIDDFYVANYKPPDGQ